VVALLRSIKHARRISRTGWIHEVYSPPYPGTAAHVAFQPKGVIGVVSPWNFPVQLAFGPVIGVLGAGNRAILKPSELTPVTSELMRQLVAGSFDELELAVVTGGPDIGAAFTALPFDHLVFTGGTAVARHVRAATDNLTPLTLNWAGKSPVIISGSADFELARRRIMAAKTLNAGQICLAPDYVFVLRARESFVEATGSARSQRCFRR
jgi:coniferyl-aldehyde dehydrogenase